MNKMKIELKIKRVLNEPGTAGWIAEHADHIKIAPMAYKGIPGAWLCDSKGEKIIYLASQGNEFPLVREDYAGKWTDAAWQIIEKCAELVKDQLHIPVESSDDYSVNLVTKRETK